MNTEIKNLKASVKHLQDSIAFLELAIRDSHQLIPRHLIYCKGTLKNTALHMRKITKEMENQK